MALFSGVKTQIQRIVRHELQSTYTVIPVVIEQVDHETRRAVVSRKDRDTVMDDNVPIASPYTGSGYGEIYPVKPGDDAFLLCCSLPLRKLLAKRGHIPGIKKHRQHSFHDGIVFPEVWFDDDEIPDHAEDEYLFVHESGTIFSIDGDAHGDGAAVIEHPSGFRLRIDDGNATIETEDGGTHVTVDAGRVLAEHPSGASMALDGDSARLENGDSSLAVGDAVTAEHASGSVVELDENGTSVTGGLNLRGGRVDALRQPVRDEHPDPTVSNENSPAYIDLPDGVNEIGDGVSYYLTKDWVWYTWRDGEPRDTGMSIA